MRKDTMQMGSASCMDSNNPRVGIIRGHAKLATTIGLDASWRLARVDRLLVELEAVKDVDECA